MNVDASRVALSMSSLNVTDAAVSRAIHPSPSDGVTPNTDGGVTSGAAVVKLQLRINGLRCLDPVHHAGLGA